MAATILVVDDNPMVRDVVQMMLNAAGYHALPAEDGSTALAIFSGHAIDAAIVDIDMPAMNGIEVCRALHAQARAAGSHLLVWLMTGVVRPDLVKEAELAGASGILAKPFTRTELMNCFASLHAREHTLA